MRSINNKQQAISVPLSENLMQAIQPWFDLIRSEKIEELSRINYVPIFHQERYTNLDQYYQTLRHLILLEFKEQITVALNSIQQRQLPLLAVSVEKKQIISAADERSIRLGTRELQTPGRMEARSPGKVLVLVQIKSKVHKGGLYRWIGTADIGIRGGIESISLNQSEYSDFKFRNRLKLQVFILAPLTPTLRSFESCVPDGKPGYMENVLAGDISSFWNENAPTQEAIEKINQVRETLNPEQMHSAAGFLALESGLQLLWGPPGTGKSTTIVTVTKAIIEGGGRVAISAHSNKAVAVLANRFIKQYPDVPVIILSNVGDEDAGIRPYQFTDWSVTHQQKTNDLYHQLVQISALEFDEASHDVFVNWLMQKFPTIWDNLLAELQLVGSFIPAIRNGRKILMDYYDRYHVQLVNPVQPHVSQKVIINIKQYLEKIIAKIQISNRDLLAKSAVIFGTLNAFSKDIRIRNKRIPVAELIGKIEAVVIDEASQTSEADVQGIISLHHKKTLMVGDPKQLRPTILSNEGVRNHFNRSMMERLMGLQQPHYMLKTQFRMTPEISHFPTRVVYDGLLRDADSTHRQNSLQRMRVSDYELVEVDGVEIERSGSLANLAEARAVIEYIRFFQSKGISASEISVITPYRGQVELIREEAQKQRVDLAGMHLINTVDASQGDESDVVLLSLVRANLNFNIGFLAEENRINVSVTRARQSLRVLCNTATFDPFRPRSSFEQRIVDVFNDLIPTEWSIGRYQTTSRMLPLVLPVELADQRFLEEFKAYFNFQQSAEYDGLMQMKAGWSHEYYVQEREVYEPSHSLLPWDQAQQQLIDGDEYFEDYDLEHEDHGENQAATFFQFFEYEMPESVRPTIGKYHVFWHPKLPSQTFGMQLLIDRMKNCQKVSFEGIPDSTFASIQYTRKEGWRIFNTSQQHYLLTRLNHEKGLNQAMINGTEASQRLSESSDIIRWFVDITETSILGEFPKWWDITYLYTQPLTFKDYQFIDGSLKGVNFHQSRFINCSFWHTDVREAKVDLRRMDEQSRHSFLLAQQWSERTLDQRSSSQPMPVVQQLVVDAERRGRVTTSLFLSK